LVVLELFYAYSYIGFSGDTLKANSKMSENERQRVTTDAERTISICNHQPIMSKKKGLKKDNFKEAKL